MDVLNRGSTAAPETGHAPADAASAAARATLTIVVPVHDEAAVLHEFVRRIGAVLDRLTVDCEILFVNDGSRDASLEILRGLRNSDPRVGVIDLSRNFGKEDAMSAGLDFAGGDAVIVMDADLQDPPECIPAMIEAWREGCDVVQMRRRSRDRDGWLRVATAHAFYRIIGRMSPITIPADVGDFRLLSRRAADALRRLPERSRFMKGMFAWIGFPTRVLDFDRDARYAGRSSWNWWQLWNFALEGITSFSATPLKLASYLGLVTALIAFAYGIYVVIKTLVIGDPVRGYPTLVTLILFLGGLQLMALGIIGEYLARMFVEVKQRPLYLVQSELAPRCPVRSAASHFDATVRPNPEASVRPAR
jgi:glycosyltransferase involved in cell wall biosynthesis